MLVKIAMISAVLLLLAASASATAVDMTAVGDYRCSRCEAMVQALNDQKSLFNMSVSACTATLGRSVCVAGYNATEYTQCLSMMNQMCVDVVTNSMNSEAVCTSIGFCRSDMDAPAYINPDGFIGECTGCKLLFHVGLDKAESFVCHGLSSAMSVYCGAGAPICEFVLDEACEWAADRCDNGCLADLICYKFHACGSGPSSGCC